MHLIWKNSRAPSIGPLFSRNADDFLAFDLRYFVVSFVRPLLCLFLLLFVSFCEFLVLLFILHLFLHFLRHLFFLISPSIAPHELPANGLSVDTEQNTERNDDKSQDCHDQRGLDPFLARILRVCTPSRLPGTQPPFWLGSVGLLGRQDCRGVDT